MKYQNMKQQCNQIIDNLIVFSEINLFIKIWNISKGQSGGWERGVGCQEGPRLHQVWFIMISDKQDAT